LIEKMIPVIDIERIKKLELNLAAKVSVISIGPYLTKQLL